MENKVKRFSLQTLIGIVIWVFVIYYLPVQFGDVPESIPTDEVETEVPLSTTEANTIPAIGLERYVGQSFKTFKDQFGEPTTEYDIGNDEKLYQFGNDATDYMQVTVDDNVVRSLINLGSQNSSGFFTMDMTIDNLRDEVDPMAKIEIPFAFSEDEQTDDTLSFTLTDHQLLTIPIISFDNGTYAILWFNPINQKEEGMFFVDAWTLSQLTIYERNQAYLPQNTEKPIAVNNPIFAQIWLAMVNIIRESHDLDPLSESLPLDELAGQIINQGEETYMPSVLLSEQMIRSYVSEQITGNQWQYTYNHQIANHGELLSYVFEEPKLMKTILDPSLTEVGIYYDGQQFFSFFDQGSASEELSVKE